MRAICFQTQKKVIKPDLGNRDRGEGLTCKESGSWALKAQQGYDKKQNKKVKAGVFMTMVEARLLERIERDRELMMEFGSLQKSVDRDSNRTIKVGPGWRQIVRDGHYKEHNGSLTLADIQESKFFRQV